MDVRDRAAADLVTTSDRRAEGEGGTTGRCLVVVPVLPVSAKPSGSAAPVPVRGDDARLDEAIGLAKAIDLDIAAAMAVRIQKPRPATLLTTGKMREIGLIAEVETVDLVVVDGQLTPVQQRNLETEWGVKVLDRTGLILEIFGRRARTKEGRLQVELAHLNYQKSRLVRSWTHLERQRGGVGFLGGPGETQIEADRRQLQERVSRIERDLDQVRATRGLHRSGRKRVPFPVIALVGYTNAGKSTLFNRLTGADVMAKDLLFATLDPTLRTVRLPHGREVILSDTVGFISDLPTDLIAAFRATLEEVREAEIILHVRDMSDPSADVQAADVAAVLSALDIDVDHARERLIEVWNKIDLMDTGRVDALSERCGKLPEAERPVMVSAVTGQGLDALLAAIEARLSQRSIRADVTLPPEDGAGLAWLYRHCDVLSRSDDQTTGQIELELRVPPQRQDGFLERFPGAVLITPEVDEPSNDATVALDETLSV
ncbi:MAG: GTPase HflX [Pseudomonadota bacterium]